MNSQRMVFALWVVVLSASASFSQTAGQTTGQTNVETGGQAASPAETSQDKANVPAATSDKQTSESSAQVMKTPSRADAYYNFTMGHIFEQQYESTTQPEYATQPIDPYKK